MLLTFIKLPFVIKTFVLSIFEWLFYAGFTVCRKETKFVVNGGKRTKVVVLLLVLCCPHCVEGFMSSPGPEVINLSFMLNLTDHEIIVSILVFMSS